MITVVMPTGQLLGGAERALLAAIENQTFRERLERVVFLENGDLLAEVQRTGVPVELMPFRRSRDPIGLARTTASLVRLVRRDRSPMVISWMTKAALVSGPAARLARAQHVIYQHGATSRTGIDRLAARLPTDLVVCCSDWAAASAREVWPAVKVATVHPPLPAKTFRAPNRDTARQRLSLDPDKTLVVMVARWQAWKRVHIAVEACADPSWPADAKLVLIGGPVPTEPAYERQVRTTLDRLPDDRAEAIGYHPEGRTWMSAADAVLHLSDAEPFGLVLVEAACAGAPLITTGTGGAAELVAQLGNCDVSEATPSGVARAVAEVLERSVAPAYPPQDELLRQFGPDSFWPQLATALHRRGIAQPQAERIVRVRRGPPRA